MNTFVEKNKKWLKFYSSASRILGWLMILLTSISFFFLVRLSWRWGSLEERRVLLLSLGTVIEKMFSWFPEGIILLGIGQLLKYIYDYEYTKTWLLRNGTKILYLFAVLKCLQPFIFYFYQDMMHLNYQVKVITSICFLFADVLVLIGLVNILKHILPVVEEHKLLV